MLIKKKLLDIPTLDKDIHKRCENFAIGRVKRVKGCGNIFVYDIYRDGDLVSRVFCDRKNLKAYNVFEDTWQINASEYISAWMIDYESPQTQEAAYNYFKEYGAIKVYRILYEFITNNRREKEQAARDRLKKVVDSFPTFPEAGVTMWLHRKVFLPIMWIGKKEKGLRACSCSLCNKEFYIDTSPRVGDALRCPHCKTDGNVVHSFRTTQREYKTHISIVQNRGGKRYIRWSRVRLIYSFDGRRTNLSIKNYDYYWNVASIDIAGNVSNEKYIKESSYDGRLKTTKWYGPCRDVYIYPKGISEGFNIPREKKLGTKLYYSPLKSDPVDIADKIKKEPCCEVLLSLGLTRLIQYSTYLTNEGLSFSKLLGITKQYIQLYQKYNPNYNVHSIIKTYFPNQMVSEEFFKKIIKLELCKYSFERFIRASKMSATKAEKSFLNGYIRELKKHRENLKTKEIKAS